MDKEESNSATHPYLIKKKKNTHQPKGRYDGQATTPWREKKANNKKKPVDG